MKKYDLREMKISSETMFHGDLLHVTRDTVRLPNGKTSMREGIKHPGAVVIIPFLDEQTLIMERQYRYMPDEIFYELPAGKTDPGEDFITTAKRELLEETGYEAKSWSFISHLYPAIGYANEKMALFAASDLIKKTVDRDIDEFLEIVEMPVQKAMKMLQKGEITDAKTMVGLFWADKLIRGEWKLNAGA
ncbi:MAG: NUDIX hydrolase [Candidatus Marinimicrobia bacterium]|nr:NUDIX hydrolase [Candidatus Neomarinimicrobiota bacterium]